jgi:hypothetical protein
MKVTVNTSYSTGKCRATDESMEMREHFLLQPMAGRCELVLHVQTFGRGFLCSFPAVEGSPLVPCLFSIAKSWSLLS